MASMLLPKAELESLELAQKQFTSSIVRAQKQMEGWHFGIRKHVFEYDSVINKQRQAIYRKRDQILLSETDESARKQFIDQMIQDVHGNIPLLLQRRFLVAQQLNQSPQEALDILSKEI
jgi:preprotein translocase subunit SecA